MCQSLACSELEGLLHRLDAGKAPGVWISVAMALTNIPDVIAIDFVEYFKNGTGKGA